MSALVQAHDLVFRYAASGDDATAVLRGINLSIEAGTTLGLIGPNGGGKTTLVRLLLDELRPGRGTIRIAGLSPRQAVARGDLIGYLPQSPKLARDLAIDLRQLVRTGLAGKTGFLRPETKADLAFADHLLDRVGLADLAHRPIAQTSGGQLQRALIARALVARPRLLVLDEPTVGIDAAGQTAFLSLINSLKTELGLTILFVSHDLRAVTAISDRVACLNGTIHEHECRPQPYEAAACDLELTVRESARVGHRPANLVPLPVGEVR
jgi:zinc transport system ATP-binding protein